MHWKKHVAKVYIEELLQRQEQLLQDYAEGREIHFKNIDGKGAEGHIPVAYCKDGDKQPQTTSPKKYRGLLPRVKAIVVGLDIREYSRRRAEQQLFLTQNLHSSIRTAIDLLQNTSLLPQGEPPITIQTGDGAYVVFTFLEARHELWRRIQTEKWADNLKDYVELPEEQAAERKPNVARQILKKQGELDSKFVNEVAGRALSFVFALNAIVSGDNATQRFVDDSPRSSDDYPTFPAEVRFAVSYDDVLLLKDVNDTLNCIGNAMVTCARILSTDHGNHFLMDYTLLKDLERHGGLGNLCGGQWGQRLHTALLDEVRVKSGKFRFADIFGFYHDGLLLHALRHLHQKPRTYHIGSHNVASIDS